MNEMRKTNNKKCQVLIPYNMQNIREHAKSGPHLSNASWLKVFQDHSRAQAIFFYVPIIHPLDIRVTVNPEQETLERESGLETLSTTLVVIERCEVPILRASYILHILRYYYLV